MIKIAICDDNKSEFNYIAKQIEDYKTMSYVNVKYTYFSNGTELLTQIKSGVFYDLIFLDIIMPDINGIDTAMKIHRYSRITKIIFLTVSSEFAVDSYNVNALDYILKPITAERFAIAIRKFEESRRQFEYETIMIQKKSGVIQIPLYTLCYVEVFDHSIIYHLSDSSIEKCRQSLSEVEDRLKRNSKFFKTHRSYIVNMDYIKRIDIKGITMTNGDVVLLSKSNYKSLTDLFLKYKLEGGI